MSNAFCATADLRFPQANKPTMYFIGVTTGKSSIMRVFPAWARRLGISEHIVGIDCKWHDDAAVYRNVVSFIKSDPLSLGALVTTHKIDLLAATRDLFDVLDPYAQLMGEISSISKQGAKLAGHAKDPITSGLSLAAFLPEDYWAATGAELFVLGAGGSSIALTCYLMETCAPGNRPARIVVSNRSEPRLAEMKHIHAKTNPGISVEYHHCPHPEDNDRLCATLKPGSLVVNATGLGKDAPGSPLTDAAVFPEGGYAWDFNYRGNLVFLDQARAQEKARGLKIEDGWIYFIHGWTRVIAEVFHIDIPASGPVFDELSAIAASVR
ncbi:MAG TPA: shikimate dehydrogenase [Candidatus Hydrogenedentes bacterium]|nr:shikimate dehydrogenase [Candidatus Hydrogenedentota bacterium]HOS03526.1 shikimate dehydrogenase [Candidatus Hydrogenedentota bacterium]